MVLGIVTGSMPMLFSLLLMQGITLTMWRSFLDKAIPQYDSIKFRKNLERVLPGQPQQHQDYSPSTGSIEQIPVTASSIPATLPASTFDQPQSDPVTNSLQILANLDPKLIQLLSQLQKPEQSKQENPQSAITIDQLSKLTSLVGLLQSMPNQQKQQLEQQSVYDPKLNHQQAYLQYAQVDEPQDQIKYYEVSSNPTQLPELEAQPEEYQEIDQNKDQNKYEYVKVSNVKLSEKPKPTHSNDLYEEVDYDAESGQEPGGENEEEEDSEEEEEEEEAEEEEEVDKNPSKFTIRKKIRPGKIFASSKMKIRFLKPPIKQQQQKMFGKPRLTKRMLRLDSSPFQYFQAQIKEKIRNSFGSFSFSREKKSKKKKNQKKNLNPKPTIIKQTAMKQTASSWRRTSNPSVKSNFRFATPSIPILQPPTPPPAPSPPPPPSRNITESKDSDELPVSGLKNHKTSSNKSFNKKMNNHNQGKTMVKQKLATKIPSNSNNKDKDDCNKIIDNKSRKQFKEIWSQKNGWNKCHIKSPNYNNKKKTTTETNTEIIDLSTTTLVPAILEEPDHEHDYNPITESIAEETITDEPATTTTTISSATPLVPIPYDPLMMNFNNFLMNMAGMNGTLMIPDIITTTSTTTMLPITTRNHQASSLLDEFPKEFLIHILNAINSSKIDDFQLNNPNNNNNNNNNNNFIMPHDANKETEDPIEEISKSNQNKDDYDNEDNHHHNGNDDDDDDDGSKKNEDSIDDEDFEDLVRINNENKVDGKILVAHRFKRVCYFLLNGGKDAQLDIGQLELHICSHLIIGYARISTNGLVVAQKPSEDTEKYRRSTLMKLLYPKLKVLISIGDLGGTMFSIVASSNRTRERFIMSILDICDEFNFDGVDIDWEFPGFGTPGSVRDKQNLVVLLKELRSKANLYWRNEREKNHFLISVAVGAPLMIVSTSYIIPEIRKYVDFVNLMSYDYHYYRPDKPYTGHHSPLYPRSSDNAYFSTLNVAWTATYWANNGMPLRKIIVGVPTYARTYNLVVPIGQNMMNVPASGPGIGKGKLNYTQVCQFLKLPGTMKQFDFHSQVPFAYRDFDWIAYENEISVAIKAQWVIKTGMGGIVTFALNFDDSEGKCRDDGKRFPLQKTISNLLELASIKSYKKSLYVAKVRG